MEIRAKIGATWSGLRSALAQSKSAVGGWAKSLAGMAKGVAGTLGLAIGGAALIGAVKRQIDGLDNLAKSARAVGTSATSLARLQYMLSQSGSSAEGATALIEGMTSAIGRAMTIGGRSMRPFDALGLDPKKLSMMDTATQFETIIKGLNGITNATVRQSVASQLFGGQAKAVLNLAGSYDTLKDSASAMVGELDSAAEASEKFNDAISDIGVNIRTSLVDSGLIDWLGKVSSEMSKMLVESNKANDAMKGFGGFSLAKETAKNLPGQYLKMMGGGIISKYKKIIGQKSTESEEQFPFATRGAIIAEKTKNVLAQTIPDQPEGWNFKEKITVPINKLLADAIAGIGGGIKSGIDYVAQESAKQDYGSIGPQMADVTDNLRRIGLGSGVDMMAKTNNILSQQLITLKNIEQASKSDTFMRA